MGIKSDVFNMKTLNETFDILNEGINSYFKANQDVERNTVYWDIDIIDVLIDQSIKNSVVFDLSTKCSPSWRIKKFLNACEDSKRFLLGVGIL